MTNSYPVTAADAVAPKITKTRLRRERIDVGSRSYRRFIVWPGPVFDDTPRCIRCGQIDEQPWHDAKLCAAVSDFLRTEGSTNGN